MVFSPWNSIANAASSLNQTILKYYKFSPVSQSAQHQLPPLVFPQVSNLLPSLLQLGLPDPLISECQSMFVGATEKMDASLREIYQTEAPLLCENGDTWPNSKASRPDYIQAFQTQLCAIRAEGVQRLWHTVVSLAQKRQQPSNNPTSSASSSLSCSTQFFSPTSSASSSKGRKVRPQNFSKEQTAVLQALLARDDKYSSGDKDLIANTLKLTREQVNRWFCNARARKSKPYSRPRPRRGSPALERTLKGYCSAESVQSGLSDQSSAESSRATSPTRSSSSADSSLVPQQPPSGSQQLLPDADQMDLYFDFDALENADQSFDHQLPPDNENLFDFNLLDPSCNPQDPSGNPIDSSLYMLDPSFNPFDPAFNPLLDPSSSPLLDPSSNPLFPSQYTNDTSMWMY